MRELKVKQLRGFDKTAGLIFAKKAFPVMLNTRFGIHTFGMKFPIDVLVLNEKNKVVKLRHTMEPNRIFLWPPKYEKVIELPAGEIKKYLIKLEDTLHIITIN